MAAGKPAVFVFMTTQKYFSLAFLGIGLVLAGFAVFIPRTHAPILPMPALDAVPTPSSVERADMRAVPVASATPGPTQIPEEAGGAFPENFLHTPLVVGERTYDLQFREGETLYQGMRRLETTSGLTIQGKNFSGIGFFIDELNGIKNGGGKYWVYSVNGAKATLGVEAYRPKPGERIVWTFEESYQ